MWRVDLARRRIVRTNPRRSTVTDMIEQGHRVTHARAVEDSTAAWPNTARLVRLLRQRTEGTPT